MACSLSQLAVAYHTPVLILYIKCCVQYNSLCSLALTAESKPFSSVLFGFYEHLCLVCAFWRVFHYQCRWVVKYCNLSVWYIYMMCDTDSVYYAQVRIPKWDIWKIASLLFCNFFQCTCESVWLCVNANKQENLNWTWLPGVLKKTKTRKVKKNACLNGTTQSACTFWGYIIFEVRKKWLLDKQDEWWEGWTKWKHSASK